MLLDILKDTVADSIRLVPFLFLTYVFMEWLEHHTSDKTQKKIRTAGKSGPLWGAVLGMLPQCGFSAAASSFFAGRVITLGTLIAIYLSTSDEMLPVMISQAAPISMIAKVLLAKVVIGAISGLIVELVYERLMHHKNSDIHIHEVCEKEHCHCEDGIFLSAAKHTLRIFVYIFVIALLLNGAIALIGEETLAKAMSGVPLIGELTAALVGMIPNCASSVVITQLYLDKIIGAGAMMSGLLCNAGVGILVLVRLNKDWKQNTAIIALLYVISVIWGVLIRFAGIVF
ncbi:MAG: arsenic efflux protein [Lachnospiraceae bacterium]|nr:arsenic efflux protein [Lachnospiraceae bacterium]